MRHSLAAAPWRRALLVLAGLLTAACLLSPATADRSAHAAPLATADQQAQEPDQPEERDPHEQWNSTP
ncbi:hypothetical protein ABZ705_08865 [Streptomyces sp. NPDC006984]|uniref:hypothetical protein n=1 Tax=Streptomyces sp. NPDC006984 TaxID=3155463 RepID=UPI0033DA9864